jgi:calcium-dependent protein kinase
LLEEEGVLSLEDILFTTHGVLLALEEAHENGIVHRDIKCENILIECSDDNGDNNDFNIKLIDFGTCNYISKNEHLTVKVGSPYYIAPEVLERNYNNKCDIWSAGVLLYILLIGFPPFNGKTQDDIFNSIQRGTINTQLPEWNKLSSLTKDFLLQLLCNDSTLRLSAQECLKHPWLQDESTSQYTYCSNETMQSVLSNIISFNAKEKLQQATIAYIVHFVYYSEDINNLKHVFQQLDTNNDGMLTFTEIKNGFDIYFGKAMSEIKLKEIVDNIDGNLDGVISYEEFLRFAIKKEELLNESNLKHAFDKFDINKDGKLSKNEIKTVLRTSNLIYINNLIKEIDVNGDGFISYDEFKNLMNYILTGKEININVTTENNTTVINNKFIMDDNNNNNVSSNNDISTLDSLNINSHIFDSKMYNSNNNLNNSVLGISIFVYNTKKNKCK